MARTSEEAVADLATLLGTTPPSSLSTLDPAALDRLTDAITAERRRQDSEIERSVDDALRIIPRPLRGIVRRLLAP